MKKVWVYDIEQLKNFHSCVFRDVNSDEKREFVVHYLRNDIKEYMKFLEEEVAGLIGFNNVNYDYPLMHYLIKNFQKDRRMWDDPNTITTWLYEESQRIIAEEYSAIKEEEVRIPQCDLFKIHHFDNKNKRTSLKWVQCSINWWNVQDMPINHYDEIHDLETIDQIMNYNVNDVDSTKHFYEVSKEDITLRRNLKKKFKFDATNMNDVKMGEYILLESVEEDMGLDKKKLKRAVNRPSKVFIEPLILDKIKFTSPEFNQLLIKFKQATIDINKEEAEDKKFAVSLEYDNVNYEYGLGGIHGCVESGVYYSSDEEEIVDIDVASFYPNLAITNKFHQSHIGSAVCDTYKNIYDTRAAHKKLSKDNSLSEEERSLHNSFQGGYKLALNGAIFGKSKDKYSALYDPNMCFAITCNGQLLISMLIERLVEETQCTILQANTDGITVRIKKEMLDEMYEICERWEKFSLLELEYCNYSKMVIKDVNNYLAVTTEGEVKLKGCFEINKTANGKVAYNKNWSHRIIPIALQEYYVNNIPIERTIRLNENIFNFLGHFKTRKGWTSMLHDPVNTTTDVLQKTNRYYVSGKGGIITKKHDDGRTTSLEKGWLATIYNKHEEIEDFSLYNVNYKYYIAETNKIINSINRTKEKSKPLSLF